MSVNAVLCQIGNNEFQIFFCTDKLQKSFAYNNFKSRQFAWCVLHHYKCVNPLFFVTTVKTDSDANGRSAELLVKRI